MFDAGIKVNYGKIESKMGKQTVDFVRNSIANIDRKTATSTRIKISTFEGGNLDPRWMGGGMIVLNNVRNFLLVKAKKSGFKNVFKNWQKTELDKEALSELFSTENLLKFLRKVGRGK